MIRPKGTQVVETAVSKLVDISASMHHQNAIFDDWDEDQNFSAGPQSHEDKLFDFIVGTLEDLLMDDSFVNFQNTFMEKNCKHFSSDEENKLIYMEIFHTYVSVSELYFTCADRLLSRPEQLEGDVFEMLNSIGDFQAFKEMIISFKQEQEGTGIDLSGLLAVTNSKSGKNKQLN
ncbi:ADP-ribosylation factor-like protein 2-binding protein [Physocladia obscura]|uniref:ADP-ribosylation factor-like protein 2-binding protein n=1 Tax=Physocladia obscura TaxID=109957 RepID=A0AAD5T356_9FUNG|nr:ADP-ribosylation factor-like protein 2-binding protein [Physocladia obscura]